MLRRGGGGAVGWPLPRKTPARKSWSFRMWIPEMPRYPVTFVTPPSVFPVRSPSAPKFGLPGPQFNVPEACVTVSTRCAPAGSLATIGRTPPLSRPGLGTALNPA